ncbi:hypothetical protein B0H19DRAFT_628579 [Mycena capillaripes]|nr:hypothetical protein B0H19DRAFT_628579 [Mycena capillaripes]
MPSIARAILLAVQAASFLALTGISPATTTALASPLQGSPIGHSANSPSSLLAVRVVSKHADTELVARTPTLLPAVSARHSTNNSEPLQKLSDYRNHMRDNADTMRNLAAHARGRSLHPDDAGVQQQCASTLNSYAENFHGFQTIYLTLDKGLACYDPSSNLQTILKDVVNYHKDILAAAADLVASIPGLGPLLSPIVDAIKCLVDELLDYTEVVLDCLLNATKALLIELLPGLSGLLDAIL